MFDRDWWKTSRPLPLLIASEKDDEEGGLEDDDDGGEAPSK